MFVPISFQVWPIFLDSKWTYLLNYFADFMILTISGTRFAILHPFAHI